MNAYMKKYAGFRTKKKMETSKKLLVFTIIMVTIMVIVGITATFVLGDATPMETLIVSVFGLASTSFGFYYWKAKNENVARFGNNVDDNQNV